MINLIIIIYSIWAIYSGWKITTNRVPALNKPGIQYLIGKIILTLLIGYVFGGLYLIVLILKMLGLFSNW